MPGWWTLDGHTPVYAGEDYKASLLYHELRDRGDDWIVAKIQDGEIMVSTVFLGLDHSFGGGPPMLFETLVFGGPLDQEMERYATWEEAEEGHRRMVERVTLAMG